MYRFAFLMGFLLFASASEAAQAGRCIAGGSNPNLSGSGQGLSAEFLCAVFHAAAQDQAKRNRHPSALRGPYGSDARPRPAPKGLR